MTEMLTMGLVEDISSLPMGLSNITCVVLESALASVFDIQAWYYVHLYLSYIHHVDCVCIICLVPSNIIYHM